MKRGGDFGKDIACNSKPCCIANIYLICGLLEKRGVGRLEAF